MHSVYQKQLDHAKILIHALPWEERNFYANYLAQTYYFVCHSTRLLARAISYFSIEQDPLYRRFIAHIAEENYHERLAEKDLKNLSLNIKNFPEHSLTKSFYESQYYKIEKTQGIGFLGYVLYLEAVAVFAYPEIATRLVSCYGEKCSKFLKVHTEEDPQHLNKAIQEIEKLNAQEQAQIWDNFTQTADIYHQILIDIKNHSVTRKKVA